MISMVFDVWTSNYGVMFDVRLRDNVVMIDITTTMVM